MSQGSCASKVEGPLIPQLSFIFWRFNDNEVAKESAYQTTISLNFPLLYIKMGICCFTFWAYDLGISPA